MKEGEERERRMRAERKTSPLNQGSRNRQGQSRADSNGDEKQERERLGTCGKER